ncbi:MAG: C25 family cysteine peptidase, partial [Kiritimatiellae bacterium]|nr:C25 family cysteine peptidase [Kiritimatiellia bacterium]
LDLAATVWQEAGGDWQTAFLSGDSATRYAVFDEGAGCFEPSVVGVRDIAWGDPAEMPELAIIVPPQRWVTGFAEAAQPLADFRNAQGLATRIIDAEEIYNAFSGGLVHPEAFRRFAAAGVTNGPTQRLRYMLFAGYGGSDYKLDVFGFTGTYPNLYPLYLMPHLYTGEFPAAFLLPNDPVLGDVTGDAVPEVAVGRFIATSAAELSAMVKKTIEYEISEIWKTRAMFTADVPEIGTLYDFTAFASNTACNFMGSGWEIDTFYAAMGDINLRPMWLGTGVYEGKGAYQRLCSGTGFFYFIGHSSDTLAGGPNTANRFFGSAELVPADWSFAPAALMLGCRLGRWTHYNSAGSSVNEAGARNPASGFAAVISPSGYMQPADARDYSYAFGAAVEAGALRLGDAWRGAFGVMGGAASERLRHMTFLGDPALTIRAGQTARGTSAAWLIGHGLTGDPYADLLDQDADGFVTWLEYLAETSPANGGVRLRTVAGFAGAAASGGLPLSFEPLAGLSHQVLSSTNLAAGVWEVLPWRTGSGEAWSLDAIEGDWPLKSVEVPYDAGERRRFYKIVAE